MRGQRNTFANNCLRLKLKEKRGRESFSVDAGSVRQLGRQRAILGPPRWSGGRRAESERKAKGREQRAERQRENKGDRSQESEVRNQWLAGQIHGGQRQFLAETAAIRRKSKLSKGMESPNPKSLIKKGLRIKPAAFLPPLPVPNLPQSPIIASIAPFFCRFGAAEAAGQVNASS